MVDYKRAAEEINTIGLYDPVLQEALKIADKRALDREEIVYLLENNKELLESYKNLNLEYNISNIHIEDFEIDTKSPEKLHKINQNLQFLRENEKYTINFEQSTTLITVMSIEFFVLFSVQYFIVLLDMKEWQLEIYALFAMSIVVAWFYTKKQKELYRLKKAEYEKKYIETQKLLFLPKDDSPVVFQ
jgi:ribosomal protein S16